MKIAFVTIGNGQDINSWSGIPFYMSRAFENEGIEVEFIGNLRSYSDRRHLIFKWRNFLYNRALNKRYGHYESFYEPQNLKYLARQVRKRLFNRTDIDIIFSPGSLPIACLDTNKPLVIWTDATFEVMQNYYPEFKGLNQRTIRNCHLYEKNALKRISLAFFSSAWAAESAIKFYGANQDKIKVMPFGANIDCNRTTGDIRELIRKKSKICCKLLFIGQNWERKGGEKAVRIAIELNNLGITTELLIVGCNPPDGSSLPDFVRVLGFLDKTKKEEENLINKLYSECHFFLLPTIAECTPIVFCEANSYGLPIITCNTGGIPSIIKNDVNGKMFDIDLDAKACAAYLYEKFNDFGQYSEFSLNSFNEYITRLNWNISIKKIIENLRSLPTIRQI